MYAGLILIVEQIMLCHLGSDQFSKFHFFSTPSEGGWGKKSDFFSSSKFWFLIYKKNQELSNWFLNAFWSNRQWLTVGFWSSLLHMSWISSIHTPNDAFEFILQSFTTILNLKDSTEKEIGIYFNNHGLMSD